MTAAMLERGLHNLIQNLVIYMAQSTSNSNNTPEMEGTECGSDIDGLSVNGGSTSCSTATTPPPELTPKGLSALLASQSG